MGVMAAGSICILFLSLLGMHVTVLKKFICSLENSTVINFPCGCTRSYIAPSKGEKHVIERHSNEQIKVLYFLLNAKTRIAQCFPLSHSIMWD